MPTRHPVRWLLLLVILAVAGCATRNMPGYQNTYQGYDIPQSLLDRITQKFREYGLSGANIDRDIVGRVHLVGSYRDEDQVDQAFTIVEAVVGLKSTSPFYPKDVKERRWEQDAARALADFAAASAKGRDSAAARGVRRALVIGINTFLDSANIQPIQGEDDARVVANQLTRFGHRVTSLYGPQATKAAIEAAIARIESELGPDDSLFVYVSSHGAPPVPSPRGGDERRMSVIAYDSGDTGGRRSRDSIDYALNLQRTSVKDTLFQQLAQKPTRVTRVLIDTCYSGEILRGVPEDSRQFILRQNGGKSDREGVSLAAWSGPAYTSKGIKFDAGNAASPAAASGAPAAPPTNRSRAGYTLITATSEGERSFGPDTKTGTFDAEVGNQRQLKGSFFTQTFSAWLEVYNGQVQPAFEQASAFTSNTVKARSQGLERQNPRIFSTLAAPDDNLNKF